MRTTCIALLISLASSLCSSAVARPLDPRLQDKTLLVCYTFSGTDRTCDIALDELLRVDGWAGRRVNMDTVPVRGNGQITMTDMADGDTLYCMSFCTLFQEWQATEEAARVRRSFENVFQLPMPAVPVQLSVELYDFHGNVSSCMSSAVDPADILIRHAGSNPAPHMYLLQNGSPSECIDVAIVAEGYTEEEMGIFHADARAAVDALISHEPFRSMRDRFNFVAVDLASRDSGVSIPGKGLWKDTALQSGFNTFYSDRYLTTLHLKRLHESLAGIPYEHVIILANTDNYGGGGIYNSYTLTTAHHPLFRPVVVHEFGHSFGALADEYYYDDQYVQYYYPDIEPWEQNITTLKDFHSKWEDMKGHDGVGLHEGGGYQSKGVWRPCRDCRMKTNKAKGFCPVCQRAIERVILHSVEACGQVRN